MKRPRIQADSIRLYYGSLSLETRNAGNAMEYTQGHYIHPMGIVQVYVEGDYCRIDAAWKGRLHIRTRRDRPTHRQISYFCLSLIKELHG